MPKGKPDADWMPPKHLFVPGIGAYFMKGPGTTRLLPETVMAKSGKTVSQGKVTPPCAGS